VILDDLIGQRRLAGTNRSKFGVHLLLVFIEILHAFTAGDDLLGRTEEDFRRFHRELMRVLRPKGAMEAQLCERAVICAWRLRRVYRIETGLFSKARKFWTSGGPTTPTDIDTVYTRLSSQRDDLAKLTRYEASTERSLRRALLDLERRQVRRRGDDEVDRTLSRIAQRTPHAPAKRGAGSQNAQHFGGPRVFDGRFVLDGRLRKPRRLLSSYRASGSVQTLIRFFQTG
jgi:hypothetical protein